MRSSGIGIAVACGLVLAGQAAGRVGTTPPPPPTLTVHAAPTTFSPNGDGIRDSVRAAIKVDQPVTLTIEVLNHKGAAVYSDAPGIAVQAGKVGFRWNGRMGASMRGHRVPDGRYTLSVTAVDAAGVRVQSQVALLVDTHPPLVRWAKGGLSPSVLRHGRLTLRFRLYDASARVDATLRLAAQTGRTLTTGRKFPLAAGAVTLRWPRRHAARLAPSVYGVRVHAVDEAGNSSTSSPRKFLALRAVRASVVARYDKVGRRIALTFDDCNSASAWASILSTLARFRLHGTFFCPGQQVAANPSLARRTVAAGNAVGSHGWDHADFSRLSYSSALGRLADDRAVWWKLARVTPLPYFRPPYGAYAAGTLGAAGAAGYGAVVLWDVDPQDWRRPGSGVIESRILSHVRPGSIVLMHVLPQTAAMLPSLIRTLEARRYRPLTLLELDRIGVRSSGGWPPYRSSTSGA